MKKLLNKFLIIKDRFFRRFNGFSKPIVIVLVYWCIGPLKIVFNKY